MKIVDLYTIRDKRSHRRDGFEDIRPGFSRQTEDEMDRYLYAITAQKGIGIIEILDSMSPADPPESPIKGGLEPQLNPYIKTRSLVALE